MKMHQASLFRSNLPQTSLVVLVTVAALLMLGTVAAYWTWNWLAPRPVLRALIVADTGGAPSSGVLFGNLRRDGNGPVSGASAVRLLGIVAAAGGGRGYAVLQLEPRQILAVREGEDVDARRASWQGATHNGPRQRPQERSRIPARPVERRVRRQILSNATK